MRNKQAPPTAWTLSMVDLAGGRPGSIADTIWPISATLSGCA